MVTLLAFILIGTLQILQWIIITGLKQENQRQWNQIRDLASNFAKQITILKHEFQEKPKRTRRAG